MLRTGPLKDEAVVQVVVGSQRAKRAHWTSGGEKGTRPAKPTVQPSIAGCIGGKCETAAAATIGPCALRAQNKKKN